MEASNWKNRNVGYRRGSTTHKVISFSLFSSFKKDSAIISVNAIKNGETDGVHIYLDIDGLTINDLEQMKNQIDQALIDLKS